MLHASPQFLRREACTVVLGNICADSTALVARSVDKLAKEFFDARSCMLQHLDVASKVKAYRIEVDLARVLHSNVITGIITNTSRTLGYLRAWKIVIECSTAVTLKGGESLHTRSLMHQVSPKMEITPMTYGSSTKFDQSTLNG